MRKHIPILLNLLHRLNISIVLLVPKPLLIENYNFSALIPLHFIRIRVTKLQVKELEKVKEKRLVEEKVQKQLHEELSKLNITTSIISDNCTDYIQVLDISVNKD